MFELRSAPSNQHEQLLSECDNLFGAGDLFRYARGWFSQRYEVLTPCVLLSFICSLRAQCKPPCEANQFLRTQFSSNASTLTLPSQEAKLFLPRSLSGTFLVRTPLFQDPAARSLDFWA
jgi:hypothetical protein